VRTDPEPYDVRFVFDGKCSVVKADPNGPESTNFLQV
jgi:hypothetical protein